MRITSKNGKTTIKIDKSERAVLTKAFDLVKSMTGSCGGIRELAEAAMEAAGPLQTLIVALPAETPAESTKE